MTRHVRRLHNERFWFAAMGVLGSLLLAVPANGQGVRDEKAPLPPARAVTQFSSDQWDDRNGLPQITVQSLAQTKDGYIWLGTQEGLVRFDGVRFTVFDAKTSPALIKPYVNALVPDRDGSLWIGTLEVGSPGTELEFAL